MSKVPAPADSICYVIVDTTDAPRRGKLNPFARKGKKSKNDPWLFGLHILVVSFHWSHWRIPVAFKLVKAKNAPGYVKENSLLPEMLPQVKYLLLSWVQQVVFLADAAYASQESY